MTRATAGLDRVVGVVLGLGLIVGGLAVLGWWQGVLTRRVPAVGRHTRGVLRSVADATDTRWWPWALAVGGILAIVLGVWWLLAHSRSRAVRRLPLAGSGATGRLSVDSGAVLDAAAADLAAVEGVRRASGRLLRDRRETVAELSLTMDADAELRPVVTGIDRAVSDLAGALGNDHVSYRVRATVARRPVSRD